MWNPRGHQEVSRIWRVKTKAKVEDQESCHQLMSRFLKVSSLRDRKKSSKDLFSIWQIHVGAKFMSPRFKEV
ncbi:hypothetical protein LDENG_00255200 [Lucifuga dentata]|nr:hypothetical protein LDENG_00255200 [Lucifuga dentata]